MQDEYPADGGVRPRRVCDRGRGRAAIGPSVSVRRLPRPGVICSCCDRGQIYCADGCARRARRQTVQRGGAALPGEPARPPRACRPDGPLPRARREKVTHHGSPPPPADDLLAPDAMTATRDAASPQDRAPAARSALPLVRPPLPAAAPPGVPAPPPASSRPCWSATRRGQRAMVTPPDIEAQILRYYHAEKWTIGTIARQLHVHHSVVRRVLAQAGLPRHRRRSRGRRRSTPICRSSARRWRSSRR